MGTIDVFVDISVGQQVVWDLVSDLDGEPKFWKGTRSVRNISCHGNKIRREITIAFRDKKCIQEVVIEPPHAITATFVEGIIRGTKTLTLEPTAEGCRLGVVWDISLEGMAGMFGGMVKRHIRKGTVQALDSIKMEVESRRTR